MTNRRQFFAALCGLGVGSVAAATPIIPDRPPSDEGGGLFSLTDPNTGGVCRFRVDQYGRSWISSNEGPYLRLVTE